MTGQLLVRSRIEIAQTLDAMREERDAITASVESGETLFMSHLLVVDPAAECLVVACCEEKHANSALLREKTVTLRGNHGGTHYEFVAAEPQETQHAGLLAIRLRFPNALLALQRREVHRVPIPPRVPLRCEVRLGPVSFDARVVDISLKGLGAIIYDTAIRIEPGTRLEKTRIMHPKRKPVVVDLVVRHVTRVTQHDGSPVNRAGCQFLGAPQDIEDLIKLFITELGS